MWLVFEPKDVSVCLKDPGFDDDLIVTAQVADLYRAWLGRIPLRAALRDGIIQVDGIPTLARAFPRWLQLSHFVGAVSTMVQGRTQTPRTRTA